jgi:NIMA (never in mitosis gene a)-related kinase
MEGFELLEKLGEGAYSVVYKVKRKEDSNIYALKKVKLKGITDKEKENALNEVRILASVKSPFVISYKEAFIEEESETLCIVMEYADKGDLYQRIVQLKKIGCFIEETDAWKIFIQMTRGLKSLHDLKILHRDLKSANIFLFSDGTAKIGDLNVSKVAKRGLGYTQTGTPYYASPEVWEEMAYDNKSDIWSLGCVTYEMLTLHPPFRAKDMEELYKKVLKGQYKRVGDKYSSDMNDIIDYLLKVNPKERPNCEQILKHPAVQKRLEFFQSQAGENEDLDNIDEGALLRTIRIPKNIIFLSDKLPEKNYDKSKSHSKIMGRNANNKNEHNPNSSLPNIKLLKNIKAPSLSNIKIINNNDNPVQERDKERKLSNINVNMSNNINNKILLKKENSNIALSKYSINNYEDKKILKKEISNISKSPPIQQRMPKYENDSIVKSNINSMDLLQLERRKYYGNHLLNNKKPKIDDIYKYYTPLGNNKYNIYGINTKSNNEGNKHEQILPNIFSNKIMGGNYPNVSSKIVANRRLKPIKPKNALLKVNQ